MNPESVLRAGKLFQTQYGGEGVDFIDQLNYQYTGGLMVIFIAIIGVRQYVGKQPLHFYNIKALFKQAVSIRSVDFATGLVTNFDPRFAILLLSLVSFFFLLTCKLFRLWAFYEISFSIPFWRADCLFH